MNFKKLFEKDPRLIYGAVSLAAVLIVIVPVINTIGSFFHYVELQNKVKVTTPAHQERKAVSSSNHKLLEKDIDYTKKVFGLLSQSCKSNHVIVKQIELPRKSTTADVEIESQQIVIEGTFINTLKAIHEIADQLEPVKISSIIFKTETINKEKTLMSQIVFQSVKLQEDHE